MTRSRSRGSPRKDKPAPAIAKKQVYVFCEGERTEPDYIRHWEREHRHQVVVVIDDFHGGPLQLVDRAIDRRQDDMREERRGRGRAFDEYWCVFDRDEHGSFDSAVNRAVSRDIRVAHTNPCIELWFMLHFVDQTAFIHRHDAQQRSKELLGCENGCLPTRWFNSKQPSIQRGQGLKHWIGNTISTTPLRGRTRAVRSGG